MPAVRIDRRSDWRLLRVIAGNEAVEIGWFLRVRLQCEVLVGAEVANPQRLDPWSLAGGLPVKEHGVGLVAGNLSNVRGVNGGVTMGQPGAGRSVSDEVRERKPTSALARERGGNIAAARFD